MKKLLKLLPALLTFLIFISPFFFFLVEINRGDDDIKYIRKNIHSPEAQGDVEALNLALRIMKQRGCSDPTSWYYQGAIHWIPDTISFQNLCDSYHNK